MKYSQKNKTKKRRKTQTTDAKHQPTQNPNYNNWLRRKERTKEEEEEGIYHPPC
jgi:hypothetical protein